MKKLCSRKDFFCHTSFRNICYFRTEKIIPQFYALKSFITAIRTALVTYGIYQIVTAILQTFVPRQSYHGFSPTRISLTPRYTHPVMRIAPPIEGFHINHFCRRLIAGNDE